MPDANDEAVAAIVAAKAIMPQLTIVGRGIYEENWRVVFSGEKFEKARDELDPTNVAAAIRFLRQCRPTKRARLSSYRLKHSVEHWDHDYVSNGELIAAALYLGFKTKSIPGEVNVLIAVNADDADRLDVAGIARRGL
jgi:hypothetical protein